MAPKEKGSSQRGGRRERGSDEARNQRFSLGKEWALTEADLEGMSPEEKAEWRRLAGETSNSQGKLVRRINGVAGQAGVGRAFSRSSEAPSVSKGGARRTSKGPKDSKDTNPR